MVRIAVLLCCFAWFTTGCGFRPIYAENTGIRAILSDVYVVAPATPLGYEVRQSLVDDFNAGMANESSPYHLNVTLRSARAGFGLRIDDVATRYEVVIRGTYQLLDQRDGSVLSTGTVDARSSFDAPEDPYSELAAEEAARERAARAVAEDIRRAIQFDLFDRLAP